MRLWHEALIPLLPRQQLLGQHRECCALRGMGWGKPHATVNYVFKHPKEWLYCYHIKVMKEMLLRGYRPDMKWYNMAYQGQNLPQIRYTPENHPDISELNQKFQEQTYVEHDSQYLKECIQNLNQKGIVIDMEAIGL